ncbi:GDSL-type esterase/lipase family protein [Eisenbergiella sp.]
MKIVKRIVIIVLVLLVITTIYFVYLMGINFYGPLKHLAISKIEKKYPVDEHQGEIIFYGASNFARWSEMETDFEDYNVQNHGFGGSTDTDLMKYAPEILYPYQPKIVVFQTGSNDYIQEKGTDEEKVIKCMERKEKMFDMFHSELPEAQFIIMSGLLLPGRSEYLEITKEVNKQLRELCERYDYMTFVDASDLTYNGEEYNESLFVNDGIHLNSEGLRQWGDSYIALSLEKVMENMVDAESLRREK